MEISVINNPFGQDWLERLRQVLPSIEGLNIAEKRLLIDGNRNALFVIGHKTKKTKAYIGMTKISLQGTNLKIETTTLSGYLFMGTIAPLIVILVSWIVSNSIVFGVVATVLFIWTPVYYIRDILKQNKFSEEVKKEIDAFNK